MAEQTSIAAVLAQLPRADERNRYFTGKFLTESDFADEQSYFLARHCLHNRLLHGWGIVSGLEVRAVADSGFEVGPGVALDPLGRELILRDPETLSAEDSAKRPFFLVIRYHCEEDERVPPLLGGERPDHTEMQANRYRESVELMAVDPGRLGGDQWCSPAPGFDPGSAASDDCATVVPLAYVGAGGGRSEILLGGRPMLGEPAAVAPSAAATLLPEAAPPEDLTTIEGLSWEHGKPLTLDGSGKGHLALSVTFSGALRASDETGSGIGEETFQVHYRDKDGMLRPVPHAKGKPPTLDRRRRRKATFRLEPANVMNRTLFVTLKCDFLLDAANRAVDGTHIGGRLPTGNGTAGGIFESWFRLVSGTGNGEKQKTDGE